jgi:hypothetical protein
LVEASETRTLHIGNIGNIGCHQVISGKPLSDLSKGWEQSWSAASQAGNLWVDGAKLFLTFSHKLQHSLVDLFRSLWGQDGASVSNVLRELAI